MTPYRQFVNRNGGGPAFHEPGKMIDIDLVTMANAARPVDQDDYGSERQVKAQNAFFDRVQQLMHPMAFEELEEFCMKASPDEMIDETMRMLREE